MARRKRKEDVPVWTPPEFDEVGYMRKEIEAAKISVVVIAWAAVGAILFYLFFVLDLLVVGFLLGILIFGALYFILPLVGLPIHGFKRRDWASHAMVYFFSFLAFSILVLNAPFGDHTYPVVSSFEVGSVSLAANATAPGANSTFCKPVNVGGVAAPSAANNTLYVQFRATDNVRVASLNVSYRTTGSPQPLTYADASGQPSVCAANPRTVNPASTFYVLIPTGPPNFQVTVTAVDEAGLRTSESITIVPA